MEDLLRALAIMAEPPTPQARAIADALRLGAPPRPADYTELFTLQLVPFASVYVGDDGMLGGEARDRVAGFWRALGAAVPEEPDHVATMLAGYAALQPRRWRHARRAFLWEHLLSWLPIYTLSVEAIAKRTYAAWAHVLRAALIDEAQACGAPERPPLHLRAAAPLDDPRRAGAAAYTSALLSPVRSGMILTRADLARAAGELGIGLRQGERRFVLAALLGQDPRGLLTWLASEARRWAEHHRALPACLGCVRAHWLERAQASARLHDSLASELRASET